MDIGALALLSEQKYAVQNLPKPKNTIVTFEDYEKITRNVMSSTEIVIHNVSKYAQQIFLELQDLREEVKNCSVKIGEELKELMRNHFLKGELVTDHHVYDGIPVSRDDFDLRKMEQTKVLQRMAQQQQELMQFIAKTEELMLKIEDESGLSLNDLTGAMHLLQQWSNTLETIEEKEKRLKREKEEQERAEREKEEEEMRRREQLERQKREKEEEEKQRKEQEEREKEEKERRQREEEEREKERERQKLEAEKKRRDWKNWPPFIFYNTRKNKFKQDLCCVLFTMPGEVTQEDFICHGSDADEDLDKCLESNDEQVLSSMITITPNKNRKITFELPIRVYVPIVGHDSKLKPSLKFTVKGKKWRHGKTLPEIKLPPQFQNVAFVGVEIPIKELSSVQCVAIASYQKYTTDVNENGKSFELNIDKNIKVRIPTNAFPGTTEVSTQSISSRQKDMLNAAKRHKELQSVKQAANLVDISCENVTKEDSDLEMYDFGWVVDKNKQKHYNVHQETLARCSRWLVNNMNPDLNTLPLDEVFDSDFVEQLGTKETTGDKNRFILRGLHGLSKKDFNTFVEKLKASQKHVASRIKAVYSSVVSSRKPQDGHSEDDFGNDFDPDFERKDGSLQIVSKLSGESWEVVTLKDYDTDQNARVVKLPAGHDKYRVLALVVPENMPEDEICKAAEILEIIHCVTNVSIICRQKLSNPHDVIIDCVPSENVVDTLQQLDGLGYSIGPSESMAFGVVDGEEIVIKFEVDKNKQKHYNVHQETLARCSRWLVNNMNPDLNTLPLDEVFDSDFVEQLGTKETTGDKNRFILRGLHGLSKKDFNTFVEKLKASQKHVASRIKAVYSSVVSSRKPQDGHSEDDFGNDFDPDFERKDGSLQIVSKLSGESWEVVTLKDYDTDQNARVVKLPAGHDKYRVLALVVPENMPEDEICKAAEILEIIHCVTNVSIICRQKLSNPHDVIIDCVPSENVVDTLQQLDGLGCSIGPSESMAFGVVDGEEIVIKFEGNLYLERYKNIALKIKFYKNVPLNRFSGHLAVVSKVEQVASDQYHGFLTFDINPNRISVPRNGSMAVYIPKPMEELIGNFAYTLDVPVKALAKFVAWQLTRENFNSTRWVRLGGYLTEGDSTLYHQIIKCVDSEKPKAPQRERCEQFILYWSMHHANEISDKVEKVIAAHHDPKLETEAQQFIRAYTSGKGLFSNDSLEKIAYAISEDWEVFAGKLGLTSDDINKIKSMHGFNVKQGLQMLDWWRLSDQAIQKGTDLVKSFHEMAKSAQLGAKLLSLVSAHL